MTTPSANAPSTNPMPHESAHLHVTGTARYVDDIPTPSETLLVIPGLSPVAKGRITTLDLDGVRQSPGIIAVLTAMVAVRYL